MRRAAALALAGAACCAWAQTYPPGFGPHPALPAPEHHLIPTVHIAPAVGWTAGTQPVAAAGLQVQAYARGLRHPRWLYVLPNGDVLVAETNAPPKPADARGLKGWVMKHVMRQAGAGTASADQITLLRGVDAQGGARERHVFLHNLHSPFGMALVGQDLFVADTDAVLRFPYQTGATRIPAAGTRFAALPAGPRNHHWTKSLVASPDGRKLYVGVGSNSNIAEHGIEAETGRAAIWEFDVASGQGRIYATGLRNPVGMAFEPRTGALWATVNERDELGNDLVPDFMTRVRAGGFYGWPYSYFGQHLDPRVAPQRPDLVAAAIMPDYALGAHTASLGLAFYTGSLLPQFGGGALIGQHGSWNRTPRAGYKLMFVPFQQGRPSGPPVDVLTGFLDTQGQARGRPVGVAVAADGAILLADDVGNTIWRVTPGKAR